MTSGWIMLALATLVCLGLFAHGLRTARLGQPLPDDRVAISRRMLGMLLMATAPLLWLLFVAICFGAFGPVRNIQPIQLH